MGKCKRCEERGKTWNGSDPACIWEGDSGENWNCATMAELRRIIIGLEYGDLQLRPCEVDVQSVHVGENGDDWFTWIRIPAGKSMRMYMSALSDTG